MQRALIPHSPARLVSVTLVLVLLAVGVASCDRREEPSAAADVSFEVDPSFIGIAYENPDLGIAYRPPVDWEMLGGNQRQAVLDALAENPTDEDAFILDVRDIFFSTESLSFSSVSTVVHPQGNPLTRESYAEAVAEEIGLSGQDESKSEIVARMDFAVNNVPVTQFRHLRSDRVTFTLILNGASGALIQLDYSIPTGAYQKESVKLESSIGTIHTVKTE